jgi:S1-C subfamily serine protease
MNRSSWFLTAVLFGITVALVQPVAVAKSALEVEAIARSVAVEIRLKEKGGVGSGVIIDRVASPPGSRQGDLYTVVTNAHVVCPESSRCSELSATEIYVLTMADGQKYQVKASKIKLLGKDLDLAIIQFRSTHKYPVAQAAASGSLKVEDLVYASGFPCEFDSVPCRPLGYTFESGTAIAVVNKRLNGDKGGYTVIYDATTLPGMSGGGVFNANGKLVAIHGYGERFKANTELDDKSTVDSKIGYNRGIPIRWLVQNLAKVGVVSQGEGRSVIESRITRQQVPANADEYFIAGFNKFVEPGDDVQAGKQQAVAEFNKAIELNPKYAAAFYARAYTNKQIKRFDQSLQDYNQFILLNPKFAQAYKNRANLKYVELHDEQGALRDYDIEPKRCKCSL